MQIAVIGSGISGLVSAWLLQRKHDVTLFEAGPYAGGHTNTVDVEIDGRPVAVDTGFIVFNDWTYPRFIRLLEQLKVNSVPTEMSFSVRCDRCGVEYGGASLRTLFAQPGSLRRFGHWRMLADILRFNRQAPRLLPQFDSELTVGQFLRRYRYSRSFAEHYLLPMGAAIWSCPTARFEQFPVRFIIEFYRNHGLLNLRNRPEWRTISGGARSYVRKILDGFNGSVNLNCPVRKITRCGDGVNVVSPRGTEQFDEVVLACHSDQALQMLSDATSAEREILGSFPYSRNVAVLHTDESILPRCRKTWSSWNYHVPAGEEQRPGVTYNMNILQHLPTSRAVCVTLNEEDRIAPDRVLGRFQYHHPVFTTRRDAAQRRHGELIRANRTSYAGAYWGNGFHEDGVNSAVVVCQRFGIDFDSPVPAVNISPCRSEAAAYDLATRNRPRAVARPV